MAGQLSQTINRIAEELSTDECKRLSYLCGVLETDSCAENVRGLLESWMSQEAMDHVFLMELMLKMRRYDILKRVLRTNKTEVEGLLKSGHIVSDYRVLMADVSDDMGTDDLKSLIFLLSGTLPREKLDNVKSFLDIVVELERRDKISSEKMDLIEECLSNIHRADLAKKINQYLRRGETPKQRTATSEHINDRSFSRTALNPVDVYRMQAEPRGVCVIIDCVGTDGDLLEQTFTSLHFRVIAHKLLSARDMLAVLSAVARQSEHWGADAFACCIISRGTVTDLLGIDSRGSGLSLNTVRRLFTSEACPGLVGKPKLFFIQSYSVSEPRRCSGYAGYCGYRDEDLETDGPVVSCGVESVPADADIFWSHCWTDETQLERHNHQSVYLQALTAALLRVRRRKMQLVDAHMEVNRKIYDHNEKNSGAPYFINLRHTLRKNIFLT